MGRFCYRCGQPGQQQGRRFPLERFSFACLRRFARVSSFLAEVTQQIHSLRASGVISSQVARMVGVAKIVARMSAGSLCTAPAGRDLEGINVGYGVRRIFSMSLPFASSSMSLSK